MNRASIYGLIFAVGLIAFGIVTGWFQRRGQRRLAETKVLPSDERQYFRNRYRRRLVTAVLIAMVGLMIGGAYLSGMEGRADALGEVGKPDEAPGDGDKPVLDDNDKQFVRFWGMYWIVVVVLVFLILTLAFSDAWATRRFALQQYRVIKDDHDARLRRDLAVYQQHKQNRFGRFNQDPDKP